MIYAIPILFCCALYWRAFDAWFQQDDFAWLGLVSDPSLGLLEKLFRPSQHGTWRPLGERAYFLVFHSAFGYDGWPIRAFGIATQCANLALLAWIVRRLTGSRVAAVMAPVLWAANSKLVIAMISNGAYVHVLAAFFLLLATYFLLQEQWIAMWAAFLVGFFNMESNVVFPALATSYAVLLSRKHLGLTLWLWPASLTYFVLHQQFSPKMAAGSYSMHFDLSMLQTLAGYWWWCFHPSNMTAFTGIPEWIATGLAWAATASMLGFAIWQAKQKNLVPLLFLSWFVALLAPVLPLRDHVTDYYLTIPLSALSALAAASVLRAPRPVAVLLLALYFVTSIPSTYKATAWWVDRSHAAERLVRQVFQVHSVQPEKLIVLEGVTDEQFWAAVAHYPFRKDGKTYVFLERGTETRITPHPESGVRMEEFFLDSESGAIRYRVR